MKIHCGYCQALIEAGATCPECGTEDASSFLSQLVPPPRTLPEIRSLVPVSPTEPERAFPVPAATDNADTQPFRPSRRPPTPLLKVLDDNASVGEVVRLRAETFDIGRERGDLQISQDPAISSIHARLTRCFEFGRYYWLLSDLESSNGVFVRTDEEQFLEDGQEFQVGQRVFRLDHSTRAATEVMARPQVTRRWGGLHSGVDNTAVEIVEVDPNGEGARQLLDGDHIVLGRNLDCDVVLLEDQSVSPRHAELQRSDDGRWKLRDLDSLNGVWVRSTQFKLYRPTEFQLGEQRFIWDLVQS